MLGIILIIAAAGVGAMHPAGTGRVAKAAACAVSFGLPKMCHKPPAPAPAAAPPSATSPAEVR